MNGVYAIYRTSGEACGEILMLLIGNEDQARAQAADDQSAVVVEPGVSDATHWINIETKRANQRPSSPAVLSKTQISADGVDSTTISRLREGSIVKIDGPVQSADTVDDGSLVIRTTRPGRYIVRIIAPFPCMPTEVSFNAA